MSLVITSSKHEKDSLSYLLRRTSGQWDILWIGLTSCALTFFLNVFCYNIKTYVSGLKRKCEGLPPYDFTKKNQYCKINCNFKFKKIVKTQHFQFYCKKRIIVVTKDIEKNMSKHRRSNQFIRCLIDLKFLKEFTFFGHAWSTWNVCNGMEPIFLYLSKSIFT